MPLAEAGLTAPAPARGAELAIAGVHVAVAAWHVLVSGVRIAANEWLEWETFWQVLPLEVLDEHLLRALGNLHMQPPLWNLLGALLHRLAGERFEAVLHLLQIGAGALVCVLLYRLVLITTRRPRLALALGMLMAAHPALVLFEAYALYPIAVLLLTTAVAAAAARFERLRSTGSLLAVVALANALVLTRSLYHPLLLVPILLGATAIAPGSRRRFAVLALLVSLPSALWLAKNEARFGVLGTSSWFGQNLWRSVSSNWSREELAELGRAGVVAPVAAALPAFLPPSSYRRFGFDRRSELPELDADHYNNLNEIELSRAYGASARQLFLDDPPRASRGAARALLLYTRPEARYSHLQGNRKRMALHDRLFSGWLWGDDWLRIPGDRGASGAVFALLVVVSAAAGARRLAREVRRAGALGALREHPTVAVAVLLAGWNLVVGCAFDLGENERFKFEVLALWWLLFAWALGGRRRVADPAPATAGSR